MSNLASGWSSAVRYSKSPANSISLPSELVYWLTCSPASFYIFPTFWFEVMFFEEVFYVVVYNLDTTYRETKLIQHPHVFRLSTHWHKDLHISSVLLTAFQIGILDEVPHQFVSRSLQPKIILSFIVSRYPVLHSYTVVLTAHSSQSEREGQLFSLMMMLFSPFFEQLVEKIQVWLQLNVIIITSSSLNL